MKPSDTKINSYNHNGCWKKRAPQVSTAMMAPVSCPNIFPTPGCCGDSVRSQLCLCRCWGLWAPLWPGNAVCGSEPLLLRKHTPASPLRSQPCVEMKRASAVYSRFFFFFLLRRRERGPRGRWLSLEKQAWSSLILPKEEPVGGRLMTPHMDTQTHTHTHTHTHIWEHSPSV